MYQAITDFTTILHILIQKSTGDEKNRNSKIKNKMKTEN